MKIIGISQPSIQRVEVGTDRPVRLRLVSTQPQPRTEHFLATFIVTFDPESVADVDLTCQSRLEVALPVRASDLNYSELEIAARAELAPLLRSLADAVDINR